MALEIPLDPFQDVGGHAEQVVGAIVAGADTRPEWQALSPMVGAADTEGFGQRPVGIGGPGGADLDLELADAVEDGDIVPDACLSPRRFGELQGAPGGLEAPRPSYIRGYVFP